MTKHFFRSLEVKSSEDTYMIPVVPIGEVIEEPEEEEVEEGKSIEELRAERDAFEAEFEALKILINQANASDEERVMNDDAIAELIYYFEQYDDFNVEKYVSDFIGCSRSACGTMANIQNIRKNYF